MFKRFLLGMLKMEIIKWLSTRALQMPQAKRLDIMKRFDVSESVLIEIEYVYKTYAISEVDRIIQ